MTNEGYWAITDADGEIMARFATEEEARDSMDEVAYPEDYEVAYVND